MVQSPNAFMRVDPTLEGPPAHWWGPDPRSDSGTSASARPLVWRSRFEPFWREGPQLIILAAVPGSGKRTWMLQCAEYTRSRFPRTAAVWTTSERNLAEAFDDARARNEETGKPAAAESPIEEGGDVPALEDPRFAVQAFIDARLPPQDFWTRLERALASRPWVQAIVRCFDAPLAPLPGGAVDKGVVLNEAALCFDSVEEALVESTLRSEQGAFDVPVMDQREKGFPYLVGDRIERSLTGNWGGSGTFTHVGTETRLLDLLERGPGSYPFSLSKIGTVLQKVRGLRWFTAEFLTDFVYDQQEATEIVARLSMLPLFDVRPNAETNTLMCVWRERTWDYIVGGEEEDQTRARLQKNLDAVRKVGIVTGQLSFLLALGELSEAEDLVRQNLRRFLVRIDPRSARIVREDTRIDASATPLLSLLRCALRARETGVDPSIRAEACRVAERLQTTRGVNVIDEFERSSQIVFAEMIAGRRAALQRQIAHLIGLLENLYALESSGHRTGDAVTDDGSQLSDADREVLRRSLYLAHFSALQADMFSEGVIFTEALDRWDDPRDSLRWVDRVCVGEVADFAGLRSLSPTGARPPDDVFYQGEAQIDIEDGRDAEAIIALRPVLAQFWSAASRTAVNGLVTQIYALAAPSELTSRGLEQMLANSCRLWEDGRPSSFLTWNAVQAYSTMGALDSARAWVERIEGAEGIFAALARATLSLWQGDPASALEALAGQDEPSLRRMMVICGILEATAHVLAEDASGATRKLEDLWRDYPHPRLFRYAFRFIPQDAFESLREAAAPLPSYIRDLFVDSARDTRTPQWIARPKLTPTELDILSLLRLGLTNKEIAERRFVTVGTLRSQLKALYRKLQARDRTDALHVASRFQLLDF